MMVAECPRCSSAVSLIEGRPRVGDAGVELWHPHCWEERNWPVAALHEPVPAPSARPAAPPRRRVAAALFGAAIVLLGAAWAMRDAGARPVAALVAVQLVDSPAIDLRSEVAVHETLPAAIVPVDLETRFPIPIEHDVPLDDLYPSLDEWVHPVAASAELYPEQASRHFGAERHSVTIRPECGAGHCGIDLDGPRGRPVLAVAGGRVVRVEHDELGADGRSGRYVRIQHDDGTLTAYMHLDDIVDGLQVGDRVEAGQMVGTLGATAVYSAPPHLHFQLEIPNHPDERGDISDTHFVDPAPFLARATIAPMLDHHHPVKPAF